MNSKFRCTGCREYFPAPCRIKINRGSFHSYECATEHGQRKAKKLKVATEKKSHSAAKRKLKDEDKSFQTKKAQADFNKFIRVRDKRMGCISCGNPFNDKYDAGHYRSTGAHPELRFNELNNNGQCVHCNQYLSGNLVDYRINLIEKIGQEAVNWIEGPHEPKRYTIENLKTIQRWFKRKTKRLENVQN